MYIKVKSDGRKPYHTGTEIPCKVSRPCDSTILQKTAVRLIGCGKLYKQTKKTSIFVGSPDGNLLEKVRKIHESTPKTLLYMKMSEKFKIEKEGEGAISRLGSECPGDIQAIEPRSGWVARRRSHSYVEERFCPMTKILDFVAICNKKRFSEWTHTWNFE